MRARARAGSALLDVTVAMALLGLTGAGLVELVDQSVHTMRGVARTERDARMAASELDRLVVYDREQLTAMSGRGELRGWTIDVEPVGADLFDVAIARTDTSPPLLRTTLYRPDTTDAPAP